MKKNIHNDYCTWSKVNFTTLNHEEFLGHLSHSESSRTTGQSLPLVYSKYMVIRQKILNFMTPTQRVIILG